jgi:hypothetical protein
MPRGVILQLILLDWCICLGMIRAGQQLRLDNLHRRRRNLRNGFQNWKIVHEGVIVHRIISPPNVKPNWEGVSSE